MNIEMNIKSFINVFYKFKYYLIIRKNVDVRYKIKDIEIKQFVNIFIEI